MLFDDGPSESEAEPGSGEEGQSSSEEEEPAAGRSGEGKGEDGVAQQEKPAAGSPGEAAAVGQKRKRRREGSQAKLEVVVEAGVAPDGQDPADDAEEELVAAVNRRTAEL